MLTTTDLLATSTALLSVLQESLPALPTGHQRVKWPEKVPGFVRAGLGLYLLPLHPIMGHSSLGIDGRRHQLLLRMWDFKYFQPISWKTVNLDIGFYRSQREPWFLPFLSVWYCLKSSVRVTYFFLFFFFFASLHIGFKTYSFSWQTVYFRSVDLCIFLDLSLHSSFSGTSLTPLKELGLGIWLRQNSHLCFFPLSCLHFIFISHVNIHQSCALLVNARLQCLLPSTS